MPAITNPFSGIISTVGDFYNSVAHNAQSAFCQASADPFGAAAVAAGVLGAPEIAAPLAAGYGILKVGQSLSGCSNLDPNKLHGTPPPFSGGQCPTYYQVHLEYSDKNGNLYSANVYEVPGPIGGVFCPYNPPGNSSSAVTTANGAIYYGTDNASGYEQPYKLVSAVCSREDGQPDSCGSLPSAGGQIIVNQIQGDTFNYSNAVDNSKNIYVAQHNFNVGGDNFTLNIPYSNFNITSVIPLEFNVQVSGINVKVSTDSAGNSTVLASSPNPLSPSNTGDVMGQILDDLQGIQSQLSKPEIDLDMLFVPYVESSQSCDIQTATLLVPKGSVSTSLSQAFADSAQAAKDYCEIQLPAQQNPTIIYSASTTADGVELFTGQIATEVKSLKLEITAINNPKLKDVVAYPGAHQKKFGSMNYCDSTVSGGGDYVYVFDVQTYLPLPKRGRNGRLRLLLKQGLSFNVWDTGERYL